MDFKFKGGYSRMTGCTVGNHPEYDRGFRNGQQSKQAEINKRLSDYQLEISQVGQACVKWKEVAEGKQAEIDALKSKAQELWTELDDRQSKEHIIEKCETIIQEILK